MTPGTQRVGTLVLFVGKNVFESGDGQASRAGGRNRNRRGPRVSGVRPNRFDHEVEFVGTVDIARHAAGRIGPDELGF